MKELHLSDDDRGDELSLTVHDQDHLMLGIFNGSNARIRLNASNADRLWAALGQWLNQGGTAPTPIGLDAIQGLVREEVARVLPLYRAPQAAVRRCDGTACCEPHPMDPDPQAVGHPEASAVDPIDAIFGKPDYTPYGLNFDYCTGCGHSWGPHSDRGCVAQLGRTPCGCTRVRSRCTASLHGTDTPGCTCLDQT